MPMDEWISLNEAAHIWLSAFEGLPPADGWKTGQDDMSGLAAENLNADFHKAVAMTNLPLKGIIKAKHGQVPTGPHVDIPATYFRYSRDFRPRLNSIESDNAEQDQTTFEASPLVDEHNPDWVEVLVHRDKITRWIKSSLRGTLLTELKNGRIKKDEAVVIAEARGVNLLTNPNPSEYDPLLEIGWTLAMAVAWIATRDIDIVRDQMNSWRTAKEYLKTSKVLDDDTQKEMEVWNVESSEKASLMLLAYEEFQSDDARLASDSSKPLVSEYHTAIKDLWLKLGNGELVARATVEGHIGQVIEQDRWQYLENNVADFGQEYVCYKDHQNGGKKWFDVIVPLKEMLRIWPDTANTVITEFISVLPKVASNIQKQPPQSADTLADEMLNSMRANVDEPSRLDKGQLEAAYIERVKKWPKGPATSSPKDDLEFLRSLKPEIPRERMREIRKAHAPKAWKRLGRRPKHLSHKD